MIIRPPAQRPEKLARCGLNRQVIDAGIAARHVALIGEFPVLIAIAAKPLAAVVVPLVGEAHRDAVAGAGPQFLDQPVVQLARPFALQKRPYLFASDRELGAIAPAGILGVDQHHTIGIARVPGVLGQPHLERGAVRRVGRQRRLVIHRSSSVVSARGLQSSEWPAS
jgi:hypothetical protein